MGTLSAQGDLSGARERYERALAAYERILGPEHPDTLRTLQNLAVTHAMNARGAPPCPSNGAARRRWSR